MQENEISTQIVDAAIEVHRTLVINFGEKLVRNGIRRVINGTL